MLAPVDEPEVPACEVKLHCLLPGLDPLPEQSPKRPKRNVMDEVIDPTSRAAQYKRLVERYSRQAKRKKEEEAQGVVFKKIRRELGTRTASTAAQAEDREDEFRKPMPKVGEEPKRVEPVAGCSKDGHKKIQPASRKEELLKRAPKRNFDLDLYHWEDEKLENAVQVSAESRFGESFNRLPTLPYFPSDTSGHHDDTFGTRSR